MNKHYTSNYEELVNEFEMIGLDKFASKYIKYDALIGESDAITFIENKTIEYYGKVKSGSTASTENS